MWDELYQVLLGLVGAGIGLAAVYAFIAHAQGQAEDGEAESDATNTPPHHGDETAGTIAERHETLPDDDGSLSRPVDTPRKDGPPMAVKLFISPQAGAPMQRVEAIEAIAGRGLKGDRYCLGSGHWTETDECEVTLIAQEDLDAIASSTGLKIQDGQHRRNIVTRNVDLASLMGRRFRIGTAYFAYARPRPPCLYLQSITEPGMARALVGRGGIGVHCFKAGTIRENDAVEILEVPSFSALLRRLTSRFRAGPSFVKRFLTPFVWREPRLSLTYPALDAKTGRPHFGDAYFRPNLRSPGKDRRWPAFSRCPLESSPTSRHDRMVGRTSAIGQIPDAAINPGQRQGCAKALNRYAIAWCVSSG